MSHVSVVFSMFLLDRKNALTSFKPIPKNLKTILTLQKQTNKLNLH